MKPHRHHLPQVRCRAFTIIELLIVLTVLALLLALLLPALSKATHRARIIACASNLRQIGVAWSAYLADNDERFPFWRQNMHWFYGGKHPSLFTSAFQLPYRPLNPYVNLEETDSAGSDVFRCTEDRDIKDGNGSPGPTLGHTTHDFYGNSYMMNFMLLYRTEDPSDPRLPVAVYDVRLNHARVVLAGDCQWYYAVNDVHWDAHFHNRHDQLNLLFLDGHADYIQLQRGQAASNRYSFPINRQAQ